MQVDPNLSSNIRIIAAYVVNDSSLESSHRDEQNELTFAILTFMAPILDEKSRLCHISSSLNYPWPLCSNSI